MKLCNSCNSEKPPSEFHKRSASADGLAARCKICQSEYDKSRANDPRRVEARKAYAETEAGLEATKRAKKNWAERNKGKVLVATQNYRANNPNKAKAHGLVGYAIKRGHLRQKPCEVCGGSIGLHAHHDDYSEPLNVRWLCTEHHREWHATHGEGLNP